MAVAVGVDAFQQRLRRGLDRPQLQLAQQRIRRGELGEVSEQLLPRDEAVRIAVVVTRHDREPLLRKLC